MEFGDQLKENVEFDKVFEIVGFPPIWILWPEQIAWLEPAFIINELHWV